MRHHYRSIWFTDCGLPAFCCFAGPWMIVDCPRCLLKRPDEHIHIDGDYAKINFRVSSTTITDFPKNVRALIPKFEVRHMKNRIAIANNYNENGAPAGGRVTGPGLEITWQDGPTPRVDGKLKDPPEPTRGAFLEDVLVAAASWLAFYQLSPWSCSENAEALEHVNAAVVALERREKRRVAQGTAGTHELDPVPAPSNPGVVNRHRDVAVNRPRPKP